MYICCPHSAVTAYPQGVSKDIMKWSCIRVCACVRVLCTLMPVKDYEVNNY